MSFSFEELFGELNMMLRIYLRMINDGLMIARRAEVWGVVDMQINQRERRDASKVEPNDQHDLCKLS